MYKKGYIYTVLSKVKSASFRIKAQSTFVSYLDSDGENVSRWKNEPTVTTNGQTNTHSCTYINTLYSSVFLFKRHRKTKQMLKTTLSGIYIYITHTCTHAR